MLEPETAGRETGTTSGGGDGAVGRNHRRSADLGSQADRTGREDRADGPQQQGAAND